MRNLVDKWKSKVTNEKMVETARFGDILQKYWLTAFVCALVTTLILALVLPSYKKQILSADTMETATYSEEQMQELISNYFATADVTEYWSEENMELFSQIMIEEMKEAGIEPTDTVKESFATEFEELEKQVNESVTSSEMSETKTELRGEMEKEAAELDTLEQYVNGEVASNLDSHETEINNNANSISNLAGDVSNTKSEVSSLAGSVDSAKSEISVIQTQIIELQKDVGDCVIRYNPEDGHFYSIYNEGTEEEVRKKLDFAQ